MTKMSRKATLAETGKTSSSASPERVYNVAAYVRLSVEGEDKERNRESITTQRYMLEKYIEKQPDMRLEAVFCDNGETGTDFERLGFERFIMYMGIGRINRLEPVRYGRRTRSDLYCRTSPMQGIRLKER